MIDLNDIESLKKIYGDKCDDGICSGFSVIARGRPKVVKETEVKEISPIEAIMAKLEGISARLEALEGKR